MRKTADKGNVDLWAFVLLHMRRGRSANAKMVRSLCPSTRGLVGMPSKCTSMRKN